MDILLIVLCTIALIMILLTLKIYNVLSECLEKQREGRTYCRVQSIYELYGWVQGRDILALQNNNKSGEEHIRVETRNGLQLVQVREIKSLQVVKSTMKVLLGNL